jgi:hypothetical protein
VAPEVVELAALHAAAPTVNAKPSRKKMQGSSAFSICGSLDLGERVKELQKQARNAGPAIVIQNR